jgi:sortase A
MLKCEMLLDEGPAGAAKARGAIRIVQHGPDRVAQPVEVAGAHEMAGLSVDDGFRDPPARLATTESETAIASRIASGRPSLREGWKNPPRRGASVIERALQIFGLAALGMVIAVSLDTFVFQWQSRRDFQHQLEQPGAVEQTDPKLDRGRSDPKESQRALRVEPGAPIGLLQIPAIDLSVMVIEGTDATSLRRGVGRIDGTAWPGDTGNLGIAGHRDGFFRELRELRAGAEVRLQTVLGTYEYRVTSTRVVPPELIEVLRPSGPGRTLTLVTCHPFDYVGAAPERFIVHASEIEPSTESLPEGLPIL